MASRRLKILTIDRHKNGGLRLTDSDVRHTLQDDSADCKFYIILLCCESFLVKVKLTKTRAVSNIKSRDNERLGRKWC